MRPLLALWAALIIGSPAWASAQTSVAPPRAVIADPPPDRANPASIASVRIPSHGDMIQGLVYRPSGQGPHPVVVMLLGFPGNEQNLDLAQAMRRAGFVVLNLHYRGALGSPGVFSFTHALEDAAAAVAFLRRDDMSARFDIDPERIFLAGHSLGAFVAANAAAHDPAIAGLVMISAWNLGEEGVRLRQPAFRKMAREREFSADDVDPLAGASADALIDETVAHAGQWDFLDYAASLKSKPVLMVSAGAGPGADSHRLAEKLRAMGDPSVAETWMPTDHAYSDHRIALETAVVAWLQRQTGARGPSR